MGLSGSLEDITLVDVLQVLGITAQSGRLVVTSQGRRAELLFAAGRVLTAQFTPPRRHLASYYLERGFLDFDSLHRALVAQSKASRHQLVGQILLEMGALTREQLLQGLRLHVRESVAVMLGWKRGEFAFDDRPPDPDLPPGHSERLGIGLDAEELRELALAARGESQDIEPPDGASWPVRARLAVLLSDDVLVQHGLELVLRADAFSVVTVPDLHEVNAYLLASEDQHPSLLVDLDHLAKTLAPQLALTTVKGLRRSWPNLSVLTFGRDFPPAFYPLLREPIGATHVPRSSIAAEESVDVVREFIDAIGLGVVRARDRAINRPSLRP
jgi:hypothetical protein